MAQVSDGSQTSNHEKRVNLSDGKYLESGVTMEKILDVDMVSQYGEYDDPERLPEWQWIVSKACFGHRGNGVVEGVWEYFVRADVDESGIPETLSPIFNFAKSQDCPYILFHQ